MDTSGADALSVWVGLSIIGSLSSTVHREPVIEEGVIGVYMTASEFLQYGADFVFSRDPHGTVLAPIGEGIGTIVADVDNESVNNGESDAVAPFPAWDADDQFVCIHTDRDRVLAGRCGTDEPTICIPTMRSPDVLAPLVDGSIADWQGVTQSWQVALEHLGVTSDDNHGIVFSIPIQRCVLRKGV